MSKFRELSPMECSYLASDTPDNSPFVNQFILEGNGELKLDSLKQAVRLAADANPGIKLKLKGFSGYRYWDDKGAYPKVSEQSSQYTALSDIAANFNGSPLNCRNSHCAEVMLVRANARQPILPGNRKILLVFRIHHAICDGAGSFHWMQEVFRALNKQPLLGSTGRLCEWDVARNYNIQKYGLDNHDWIPVQSGSKAIQLFESHWQCLSINQSVKKPLAKLVYLFAQMAWEANAEGHVCFRIPSDLRRLLDDRDIHMGNLTGAIDIEVKPEDSIETIYQRLIKAKRKNLDLSVFPEHLWIAKWLPKWMFLPKTRYFKKRYAKGHCNISAIVSQIGKVDLEQLSSETFHSNHIYAIPIPIEGVSLSCGIWQKAQGIDICLSAPKSLMTLHELEALTERIQTMLLKTPANDSELDEPILKAN